MLIPFIIEPEALAQFSAVDVDPYEAKMLHLSVVNLWKKSGVLLLDGNHYQSSKMHKYIEALPDPFRDIWIKAMKSDNFAKDYLADWDGKVSPESVSAISSPVSLVIVDYLRAIDFDLDEDCYELDFSVAGGTTTVCRSNAFSQTRLISTKDLLSNQHIKKDTLVKDVWDTRFKEIVSANYVRDISVVDRYAISRLFSTRMKSSGLEWFITQIAKCAKTKKTIRIYASDVDFRSKSIKDEYGSNFEINEKEIKNQLSSLMTQESIPRGLMSKINVIAVKDSVFREYAHDRFFRMEKYVWDIGCGLEIFEGKGNRVDKNHSATFKSHPDLAAEYKAIEYELEKRKLFEIDALKA